MARTGGPVGRRSDVSNGRWQASETADLLGTTTTAVNSMLRRARTQLGQAASVDNIREPADPRQRTLLDQYAAAFENADGIALTGLLRADATLEMPPSPTWFAGRDQIAAFLTTRVLGQPGDFTMVPVAANGQPGFAAYLRDRDGRYRAHAVHVLTVDATSITRVVSFNQPELFAMFGLPPILRPLARPRRRPGSDPTSERRRGDRDSCGRSSMVCGRRDGCGDRHGCWAIELRSRRSPEAPIDARINVAATRGVVAERTRGSPVSTLPLPELAVSAPVTFAPVKGLYE